MRSESAASTAELLRRGWSPNITMDGRPLLDQAAERGSLELLKVLLQQGAAPEALDGPNNQTAIVYASQYCQVEAADVLAEHSDVNRVLQTNWRRRRGWLSNQTLYL